MVVRYKQQLGAAMAKRRAELGLTQKDIAEAVPVKEVQTVSRWERGLSMPTDLEAVAAALKTTIAELMSGIQPPTRVARKLDIAPASEPDGSRLDRIEQLLNTQGQILQALRETLEGERATRAQRAAAKARQPAPGTPRAVDRRRRA